MTDIDPTAAAEADPAAALPDMSESSLGPAMAALTAKQRRFVLAMCSAPLDSAASWARLAGYSDGRARFTASELFHSDAVQAAVLEVAKQTLGTIGPILAARQLIRIAADPKHPHQLKAVEAIAARVGLPEIEQIEVRHTDLTGEALVARISDLAAGLGSILSSSSAAMSSRPKL